MLLRTTSYLGIKACEDQIWRLTYGTGSKEFDQIFSSFDSSGDGKISKDVSLPPRHPARRAPPVFAQARAPPAFAQAPPWLLGWSVMKVLSCAPSSANTSDSPHAFSAIPQEYVRLAPEIIKRTFVPAYEQLF